MYPHFIEIHAREDGAKLMINIDNIIGLGGPTHDHIAIRMSDNSRWVPRETYDEVKRLIESSGALIQMGDPRLDTSKPLTWNDLKGLIGQPIWDSNKNVWYLVRTMAEDEDSQWWEFTDPIGNTAIAYENSLIKCPLYRMKVNNGQQN